jgi:glycosyltransferase involved in cell wall biosynthesis
MKITVITSTFNCGSLIDSTAKSICNQTHKDTQWIVVDGMSSDDTNYFINVNRHLISNFIQESDSGIYDAWNKGCKFILGDWVIFLGAGDTFIDANVLTRVVKFLKKIPSDFVVVYGNVKVVDESRKLRYIDAKKKLNEYEYGRPALPNHQGVFHNKSLFNDTAQLFDNSLKIAGDSKFLLQASKKGKFMYVDIDISEMIGGGISNNFKNIFLAKREISLICNQLNIEIPFKYVVKSQVNWIVIYIYNIVIPKIIRKLLRKIIDAYRLFPTK